jgi:hypothetical protein
MNSEDEFPDIQELVVTLARIPDLQQRSYALASRLKDYPVEFILEVFTTIRERALSGNVDFLRLFNGLLISRALSEVFGPDLLASLAEMARARDLQEIAAFFEDLPAKRRGDHPLQPYLDQRLRELPLGMRKTLARTPDFKMIQKISRDQDHRVIHQLLKNPRLTEQDVVRIIATRPNSPKVIEEIYHHPKWIIRYSVKKAIVLNPYSPPSLAMRLVAFLSVTDLEFLLTYHDVDVSLHQEAERILATKNLTGAAVYSLE